MDNQSSLFVQNYLFLLNEKSENGKRMKRKLLKKRLLSLFECKYINNNFEEDSIKNLREYLINIKKKVYDKSSCVGVLTDDNIFKIDITKIPNVPKKWDILFLEYDLKHFDYKNEYNNIYWCKSTVLDSRHFIINIDILDKLLQILKNIKKWSELINSFETFDTFSITKTMFSERVSNYIKFPYDKYNCKTTTIDEKDNIMKEYSKENYSKLKNIVSNEGIINPELIKNFDLKIAKLDDITKYNLLPNISLISMATNKNKFFHLLHTFLRLNYPKDKLELIVVDDCDIDKLLKNVLPNDKRIKFINISKKNQETDEYIKFPLGYKLNIGIKYSSYEVVSHFFDTNVYINDSFMNLVKCYLMSGKDLLLSKDLALYNFTDKVSKKGNTPDIANMIYLKSYWKTFDFDNTLSDSNILVYKYTYFRKIAMHIYHLYIFHLNCKIIIINTTPHIMI